MNRPKLLFFVARPATFAEIIACLTSQVMDVAVQPISQSTFTPVSTGCPDLVVIEHSDNAQRSALDLAGEVRKLDASIPIVIDTTEGSEELAIGAMRAGLQDYVKLPSSTKGQLECWRGTATAQAFITATNAWPSLLGFTRGRTFPRTPGPLYSLRLVHC